MEGFFFFLRFSSVPSCSSSRVSFSFSFGNVAHTFSCPFLFCLSSVWHTYILLLLNSIQIHIPHSLELYGVDWGGVFDL